MKVEEEKKTGRGGAVLLVLLLVLGAAAIYLGARTFLKAGQPPRGGNRVELADKETVFAVTATEVVSGEIKDHLDVNGDIIAASKVDVFSDTSGKLARLYVELGDYVKKNQTIAEVDPSRPGMTYSTNPVKAAISGTVTMLPLDVGATVSPQIPVASIGELSRLQARVFIPERFIARISMGMTANLSLEAYPGERFQAVVSEISPIVDEVSRTLEVTMDLSSQDPRIKAGMYAEVSLITEVKEGIVKIPSACLLERFGETFVFVLNEEDRVEKRLVTEGIRIDGISEILEGLTQGERIVFQGQSLLDHEAAVKVIRTVRPLQ